MKVPEPPPNLRKFEFVNLRGLVGVDLFDLGLRPLGIVKGDEGRVAWKFHQVLRADRVLVAHADCENLLTFLLVLAALFRAALPAGRTPRSTARLSAPVAEGVRIGARRGA